MNGPLSSGVAGEPRAIGAGVLALELPGAPPPEEALGRLAGLPGRVLLESRGPEGRFSFLAADPVRVVASPGAEASDPFAALAALLDAMRMPPPPDGIHFAGGVLGFLGYEAGALLEPRLQTPRPDDLQVGEAWFGAYDVAVQWDHRRGRCTAVASILPGVAREAVEARVRRLVHRVLSGDREAQRRGDGGQPRRVAGRSGAPPGSPLPTPLPPGAVTSLDRADFEARVERIRTLIRAGDLFQANLTRRISVPVAASGAALYAALVAESPAPYAAYLDTGATEIASISPELFLSVRGQGVATRPIKGTRPRGMTPAEDDALREALATSAKDRAENVMIVDLLRNDLSRVCLPGSIGVPELARVEAHPTVHHLVSTVTGTLAPGVGLVELLRATFPGGSVTGAPKIRAMEVLRELEPVRRGVYTGAIGILGFHGDAELSVAIRTAVVRDGWAHYGTGGGITLGSNPAAEWEESEDKARAFLGALGRGIDS